MGEAMRHRTHTPARLTPALPSVWSRFKSWLSHPDTLVALIDVVFLLFILGLFAYGWPKADR